MNQCSTCRTQMHFTCSSSGVWCCEKSLSVDSRSRAFSCLKTKCPVLGCLSHYRKSMPRNSYFPAAVAGLASKAVGGDVF